MTGPGEFDRLTPAHAAEPVESVGETRPVLAIVSALVWPTLAICAATLYFLIRNVFAMAVGRAFHAGISAEEQVPLFWWLFAVSAVLALIVMAALVSRRWGALIVALVIGCAAGVFTVGTFSHVRSVIAPIEQTAPRPLPCQCHSGSSCDCPGG